MPLQVEGRPAAQVQSQLLWKLRQYLDQLLQAGSLGVVMQAVLQDLKAGLHISRLSRDDFVCFFRLAQLTTAYVRIQQVRSMMSICPLQHLSAYKTTVHLQQAGDTDVRLDLLPAGFSLIVLDMHHAVCMSHGQH